MPSPQPKKSARGGPLAARTRAAAAYADLNRKDLGALLGYSVETISALFAGEKTLSPDEISTLVEATGVPATFMEVGFAPLERPVTSMERRLIEVEQRLARLEAPEVTQTLLETLIRRIDETPDGDETQRLVQAARAVLTSLQAELGDEATPGAGDATSATPPAPDEETPRSETQRAS